MQPTSPVHHCFHVGTGRTPSQEQGRGCSRVEYPSWSSPFWPPNPICFDEGICEFDEFSHLLRIRKQSGDCFPDAGGEGDLGGFSGPPEFVADCLEVRVEAHGDEGWHIERVAQVLERAAFDPVHRIKGDTQHDQRLAFPRAGLARHGCQTGETGHLFAGHGADPGAQDQHGGGRDRAGAGNGPDDFEGVGCRFSGSNPAADVSVDVAQMPSNQRQAGLALGGVFI